MNKEYRVDLKGIPSLLSLYRKIFFVRKPGWDEQPLPYISVATEQVKLARNKVARYAKVCGFEFDGKTIPLTYLYVVSFRLHASIFTHEGITFPLLGIIHLKNSITQYRALGIDERYDIECAVVTSKMTDAGLEFDFLSKAKVDGELVWESLSTYLYRIEGPKRRVRPPKANDMNWAQPVNWSLPEDIGRRYAKASGDYNLIHLHPFFSKRFGFERGLVHGMWSKGRCIAQMMPEIGDRACKVEVEFKLPLFMPSEVSFDVEKTNDNLVFELRDHKGRRPHLSGEIHFIE
ncbi:MaoC/PaaZ C-terminal domain-containing protein [uncultured Shewanella sp.]|uniref:MaoC/PaaZ C-terminal domain-containing protein n=1 Tax=uncultured Shewanella sp. TaxID=173975 RepID=UPI002602CA08|nr:MaoC/PaaZ C-terminal domain-containing protein [uncultured Shewanella sp.]